MTNEHPSQTGSILIRVMRNPADPQAWSTFVTHYGPRIYGWCRRWGLQEADIQNVTQDVLIKLFRHLPAFNYDRQKGAFRAWLKTITRHALSDYQESQKHAGIGSGDTGVFERLQTLVAREELVKELEAAFDLELLEEARRRVQLQVTPRDWKIFTDLTVLGQSGPVVAAELQMTVTAVLMVKSRVQKKLRNEVRQLEGPSPEVTETTP